MAYQHTPDEIEKLLASGQLTPETAAQLQAATPPPPIDQSGLEAVKNYVGGGPSANRAPASIPAPVTGEPPFVPQKGQSPYAGDLMKVLAKPDVNTAQQMVDEGHISPETAQQATAGQPQPANTQEFLPAPASSGPAPVNPMDKYAKGIDRAYVQQQGAAQAGADAAKNLADETARALQDHQFNAEKLEADRVQREAARQAQYEKEVGEYDTLSKQLLNAKVDPDRYWNSRSTGQKVLASISLFLGGLGGGVSGKGGNVGLDIINKAIDADIDSQKSDLDRLQKVGGMKQTVLSMMRDKFTDERQAESATKAFHLDQTVMKLKEVAARNKGPEVQAQVDGLIGQLEAQKMGLLAGFEQASKAKQVMLGGGQQLPPGVDVETLPADQRERYVTGMGLATTKEGAKEMMKLKASTDGSTQMLGELIKLTHKTGKSINPETKQYAESLSAMLKGQVREGVLGPGTVNESERKVLDNLIKDPTAIFSMDGVSRMALQTVMDRLQANLMNNAKAHGLRPVSQQVTSFQKR